MAMTFLKNTMLKNPIIVFIGFFFRTILNFINRTYFIHILGLEYLGLNSLFTDLWVVLSLSELGLGTAVSYCLYEPLANSNRGKIVAYMKFLKCAYQYIGGIIFALGLILIPVVPYIVKNTFEISYIYVVYLLFLFNTSISYFFTYKRILLIADQKSYIESSNTQIFFMLQCIIQIALLVYTKNYIMYLIIWIFFNVVANLDISRRVNKLYPWLTEYDNTVNREEKQEIYRLTIAQGIHRISTVLYNSMDTIILSAGIGIYAVGVYSSYTLLFAVVTNAFVLCFNSLTASIGNIYKKMNMNDKRKCFFNLLFINHYLYAVVSIVFYISINDFIKIWLKTENVLPIDTVSLLVLNFYVLGMKQTTTVFRNASGLFLVDKYKGVVELVIKLGLAISLLATFGINGILIATLISTITVSFWVEPYVLFKHSFASSSVIYYKKYLQYVGTTLIIGMMCNYISKLILMESISGLIIRSFSCFIFANCLLCLASFKLNEFVFLKNSIVAKCKKKQ